MVRDQATTQRLAALLAQLIKLTTSRQIHWERQVGSAHRYARWKNNLLILGPAESLDQHVPRYLFITPFDSPAHVEINSSDPELGEAVMRLVEQVEDACKHEPPTDPFAITDEVLSRLN
jgi:hypothetical protein